jgi:membrane protein required for beta-lactamase induction
MKSLDTYRELELKLAEIRKKCGVGVDEEEDHVLDEMDWIWTQMTEIERKAVDNSEGATGDHAERFRAYAAWIKANREKYAGNWIAVQYTDQQVVELLETGTDVDQVLKAAWKIVKRPFIHYIPTPEEEALG